MHQHTDTPLISADLSTKIDLVIKECKSCDLCVRQCAFLTQYGDPGKIARGNQGWLNSQAFECSLCHLCTSICPFAVDPADMFLEMRREDVRQEDGEFAAHKTIINYEKRGFSPRYSYCGLPEGCDTVFFPGCSLPGSRPDTVINLFHHLQKNYNSLGIILDCCTKPSHDLGKQDLFEAIFGELHQFIVEHQVKKVIVACPNCYKVFKRYGGNLTVVTVYEELDKNFNVVSIQDADPVTIHDPCAVRFEEPIHLAVRSLMAKTGLTVEEMEHARENTVCCGEGGSVSFIKPGFADNWGDIRQKEARGRRIVTYCAGCTSYLNPLTPTSHILDLLFSPGTAMGKKFKISRPPFTYLNRLKVKKYFRKNLVAAAKRERPKNLDPKKKKGRTLQRLGLLSLLIATAVAVRTNELGHYLDQEKLQQLIEGYGAWGPVIFMAIYAIAPCLFLPGLPLTLVAGVLFGPFWGVIYAICGATTGATFAFLIGRYAGRQWLEEKLSGPRWRRLDQDVERQGWKIVALTRLIPLFPFNLLNYAFGLTRIKLLHYIVASFFFMLPNCIAYILLSSSLLDVFTKGSVSPLFIAGLTALALLSGIPLLYKKIKKRG